MVNSSLLGSDANQASNNPAHEQDTDEDFMDLAVKVAKAYYFENLTKVDIADRLKISRFRVARLLDFARESGIVQFSVRSPNTLNRELADDIKAHFPISNAYVLERPGDTTTAVGRFAAEYIGGRLSPADTVGLAWSPSADAIMRNVQGWPACNIVQMCGVLSSPANEHHDVELVRGVADRSGSRSIVFYAPLVVSDARTAQSLRSQPDIQRASNACDELDIAVITVGMWRPGGSTVYDALSLFDQSRLAAAGAVAETCGILFDEAGHEIEEGLQDRTLTVTSTQLRNAKEVILVSPRAGRGPALESLLLSGLVTTLVTHDIAALELT